MTYKIPDVRQFDDIKRHLVGPVMIPDRFDRHDEALSVNEVEAACHYYNTNYFGSTDINHAYDVDCTKIIESYILETEITLNGTTLPAGTWMAKLSVDFSNTGDVIWESILNGELQGFSPEGDVFEHKVLDVGD